MASYQMNNYDIGLEKWDADQGRAMKNAESSLRKHVPQKHFWSPVLRNAGLLCRYWQLRLYGIRKDRNTSRIIERLRTEDSPI
jgi:hypothetical protein